MTPSDKQRVLGVDLSDYTGWAVLEKPHKLIECGLLSLKPGRCDSYGSRYVRLRKALTEILSTYKSALVCYEIWEKHQGVYAAQILGGHLAVLTELLEEMNITGVGVGVQKIKAHATGNHRATKDLMVKSARLLWPNADIASDDVADALHIARLGIDTLL